MSEAKTETLKCVECGKTFKRELRRGRKPQRCPRCAKV